MIISDLNDRRIEALKNRDKPAQKIYSYLLSVAQKVEKDDGNEDDIITAFRKERKGIQEVMEFARNDEERKMAQFELSIVDKFLPKMMTEDEVYIKVLQLAEVIHPISAKDKGKFIKELMSQYKGQVDGKTVSAAVNKYFNSIF